MANQMLRGEHFYQYLDEAAHVISKSSQPNRLHRARISLLQLELFGEVSFL